MMETTLKRIEIDCLEKVFSACTGCEETAESVVPDVLPDICEIIDSDGLVLLKAKTVEQGRICLSGSICATVLYLPENGSGPCRLSIDIPYSVCCEDPELTEDCRPEGTVRLRSIDARILNPRKVLVRADLEASICAYKEKTYSLCCGVEESELPVEVLEREFSFTPITSVREKTFVLSDEYQIPASKPQLGVILKERLELSVDDVKCVGNKLVFKGIAHLEILYEGTPGELTTASWSSSFSQIMEVDSIGENPELQVSLMLTGAYFEPLDTAQDGRVLTAELHIVAQAVCMERAEFCYIADAYSNKYELELGSESLRLYSFERTVSLRENVRELIETPSAVKELVDVYINVGSCLAETDGTLRCPLNVTAVYRDESDALISAGKRLSVETGLDLDEDMLIEGVSARCSEVFATPTSGGLELRAPVDISAKVCRQISLSTVSRISADEDCPIKSCSSPSVTVLQCPTSDLWSLAKKYRSTTELILAANNIADLSAADGILLIPGCR